MNKKGISAIVATVLIILITVAAVTIIWVAIVPLIKNSLQGGTACFDAVQDFSIDDNPVYTCYSIVASNSKSCDATKGQCVNLSIKVHRGSKKLDISDFKILVDVGGNTNTYLVSKDSLLNKNSFPKENEDRVYKFDIDGDKNNDEYTNDQNQKVPFFNATKFKVPDSVSLVPVLTVKNKEKVCQAASTITEIPKCS